MKARIGVELGTGYTHSVTATSPGNVGDEYGAQVEWRIAARKSVLKTDTRV